MNIDDLLAWLEEDFSGDDLEETKVVAKTLAAVFARKVAGDDVEAILAQATAAAANLSPVAREKLRMTFIEWSREMALGLVTAALT